jgi:hypothetical protein
MTGSEFYHSIVAIADGVATKKPLVPTLPVELTTILAQPLPAPRPVEDKWLRFSRRLKQK